MANPTDLELLEAVRTAIKEVCESGETITADGVRVTMATIDKLLEAEKRYEAKIRRASNKTANVNHARFRRPR